MKEEGKAVEEKLATVIRIIDGLGFVQTEGVDGDFHPFHFRVIENYRGEYPRELKQFGKRGLREGVLVWVTLEPHPDTEKSNVKVVRKVRPVVFVLPKL